MRWCLVGVNALDYSGYPDCRPEYYQAFAEVVRRGTRPESGIRIETPVIAMSKEEIVRTGIELGAPLDRTWSCYQFEDEACGVCEVVVKEGGGDLLPTETGFISRGEAKRGCRLACQVKVKRDMKIEIAPEIFDVRNRVRAEEMLNELRRHELMDAQNVIRAQNAVGITGLHNMDGGRETLAAYEALERVGLANLVAVVQPGVIYDDNFASGRIDPFWARTTPGVSVPLAADVRGGADAVRRNGRRRRGSVSQRSRVDRSARPARDHRLHQGLLRGPGDRPLPLEADPGEVQGLHRHAQGEHVPVAPHDGDRPLRGAHRDPDSYP